MLTTPAPCYARIRTMLFNGSWTMGQFAGTLAILKAWEDTFKKSDTRFVAYSLATAYHETGRKMLPVREVGEGSGHQYGIPTGPWGQVYYGRGLVQMTWYKNYDNVNVRLRQLGVLEPGEDLTKQPDLALRPDIASALLVHGMVRGWFTGTKLSDVFNATKTAWATARMVINGTDQAAEIAVYAEHFFEALKDGGWE
jgi:putative chitinase